MSAPARVLAICWMYTLEPPSRVPSHFGRLFFLSRHIGKLYSQVPARVERESSRQTVARVVVIRFLAETFHRNLRSDPHRMPPWSDPLWSDPPFRAISIYISISLVSGAVSAQLWGLPRARASYAPPSCNSTHGHARWAAWLRSPGPGRQGQGRQGQGGRFCTRGQTSHIWGS